MYLATWRAFAVIILVVNISSSRPNLLMAAFGLSNGIFSSDNTERNLSAAPIITTTKNSTLSILYTIPLGYGEPESIAVSILHLNTILKNIAVNPSTNLIYLLWWNCSNACDYPYHYQIIFL